MALSEKWENPQGHFKDVMVLQWWDPIFDVTFEEHLGQQQIYLKAELQMSSK